MGLTLFEQLNFFYNWNNKLACTSFTTFRLHNPRKFVIGKKLSVMLTGKNLKDVEVRGVKIMKLHQVNEFIAQLDSGYSVEEFLKIIRDMYKNKNIDLDAADWNLVLCRELKADVAPKKPKVEKSQLSLV